MYEKLVDFEITDKKAFLYSFVACVMTSKTGNNFEKEKCNFIPDSELKRIYPFFNSTTLLSSIKKWIVNGDWNEELVNKELTVYLNLHKAAEPKDVLRYSRFMELGEEIIKTGFSEFLNDCYAGVLDLNDYVLFIENSSWSRKYEIELPEHIDWKKVISGIHICFNRYIEEYDLENNAHHIIGKDSRIYFTEDELKAYDLIAEFRSKNVVVYENNKKNYISLLKQNGLVALKECRSKMFNAFDNDMAVATFESFIGSSQSDKAYFPGYFDVTWKTIIDFQIIDMELTKTGLNKLSEDLKELKEQYLSTGRKIASIHTETFITVILRLISQIEERMGKSATEPEK